MRIFDRTPLSEHRRPRRSRRDGLGHRCRGAVGDEQGFLLVEVMMSALLVALIVVGTFNGFDVAGRVSADQRRHNQAAVLAAQSQEQLRTDPASALETLETKPHTYTQTVNGTTYTITETAKYISDKTQSSTCTAASSSEANKLSSNYLQITSAVGWSALGSNRPKVEQSSIITPPTGSALEADVVSGASPAEGVSGVTATVEYTGVESSLPTTVEGTTGTNGCITFGAIPATTATLKIKPPSGYVTPAGAVTIPSETLTLAPNITTHKEFTLNAGGAIEAEFTWKGTPVKGETFVAFNTKMVTAPEFILGDTTFSYESGGEEHYTPLAGSPATTATTPIHSPGYPAGDLFPWSTAKYVVYAGDCTANSPTATSNPEALKPQEATVAPGATSKVTIPLSQVTLNVYKGTVGTPETLTTENLPVQLTDSECASATPDNAAKGVYVHEQKLSNGHLEYPYQPFGKYSLCVYSSTLKKNYTVTYTNETQAGSTRNIYLKSGTEGEQTVESSPSTPC